MTSTSLSPELIQQATDFHGHWCPGLAVGIRASEWVLREMGKAGDEEIVAVVETDMCGVDAIQFLTGCTFGKGNLIHKDYGKRVFTFYRRSDGKAARLSARSDLYGEDGEVLSRLHRKMLVEGLSEEEEKTWHESRARVSEHIMNSDLEELFDIREPDGQMPKKASILASQVCEKCGESVMETRIRHFQEKALCIPCFDSLERRC